MRPPTFESNSLLLDRNSTHYINFDVIIEDYGRGISQENIGKLFFDFNKLDENAD